MKADLIGSIEAYVLERSSATTEELCTTFGISKNTLRKYLVELEKTGRVRKIYGGAIGIHLNAVEPEVHRAAKSNAAKNTIGRLAATLVEDGDIVFLDSGSTVAKIVPWLAQKRDLTIVTSSYPILCEAVKLSNVHLFFLGGEYYPNTNSFYDESMPARALSMNFNKLFLGCMGVTVEGGVTNTTHYETTLKLNIIQKSQKIILMADSTKIGKNALRTLCKVNDLHAFVTDTKPTDSFVKYCGKHKVNLLYDEKSY